MSKPLIAVTMGDPAGVGPEIVAKSLASEEVTDVADCVIVGDRKCMENAIRIVGADLKINVIQKPAEGQYEKGILNLIDLDNVDMDAFAFGKVSGMCGKAAYDYIARSIELANAGEVDAVSTTPINKEALKAGDVHFIGHTEIFGALTGTEDPLTMFETNGIFPDKACVPAADAGHDQEGPYRGLCGKVYGSVKKAGCEGRNYGYRWPESPQRRARTLRLGGGGGDHPRH